MTPGTVTNFDDSATVRFERVIDAAIDRVWQALTEQDDMSRWLAPTQFEARSGGAVSIDFGEGGKVVGTVTAIEAPNTLEYTWDFTGEGESILRFELTANGPQTKLVLEHRLLPHNQGVGYGAGWHAHLDVLEAHLGGREPVDWDERFSRVIGHYTSSDAGG
jgi:uncharacterized protein YndB with AHSA1/START domain